MMDSHLALARKACEVMNDFRSHQMKNGASCRRFCI